MKTVNTIMNTQTEMNSWDEPIKYMVTIGNSWGKEFDSEEAACDYALSVASPDLYPTSKTIVRIYKENRFRFGGSWIFYNAM
jgi:hypothetical protein